jgi:uncharacterized protein (TIGR02300 family)
MPAKDLGTKHTCFKCGTKFYDMKKPAPICPKCGADQRDSPAVKAPPPAEKRARAAARPAPAPPPVEPDGEEAEAPEAEVDEELDGDEEADEAAEDADEP